MAQSLGNKQAEALMRQSINTEGQNIEAQDLMVDFGQSSMGMSVQDLPKYNPDETFNEFPTEDV